jgi:[Skp1-protein]-hydroxyproline N-acetylglucosaminyltransferase
MLFQGEEADIAIRGFTFGYDFYAPELSVAFHIFAIKGNIARRERHKYWENEILYTGALEKSLARLNGIIVGTAGELKTDFFHEDVEKYGVGGVREKETYYRAFGFHTDTQTTEGHLCQFVEESMHKKFQPHLRQDGMGIDYSTIDYEYVDAHPSQHVILNV